MIFGHEEVHGTVSPRERKQGLAQAQPPARCTPNHAHSSRLTRSEEKLTRSTQ